MSERLTSKPLDHLNTIINSTRNTEDFVKIAGLKLLNPTMIK